MSIYEIVYNEISSIFDISNITNINVLWVLNANSIVSYIICIVIVLIFLAIPILIAFYIFKTPMKSVINSNKKGKRLK